VQRFGAPGWCVCDAAVEALVAQDADFDLDHIEPTRVLGRVMEFDAIQDAMGVCGRKSLVERSGRMGGQVVQYDPDPLGFGVVDVDEIAHARGEILGGPLAGDFHLAPWSVGVDEDWD